MGQSNNGGITPTGKQKAKDAIDAQTARIRSIPDMVRGPGKKTPAVAMADVMSRLPYHPRDPYTAECGSMRNSSLPSILARRRLLRALWPYWVRNRHGDRACEAAHTSGFDELDAGREA